MGIALYFTLKFEPSLWIALLAMVGAIVNIFFCYRSQEKWAAGKIFYISGLIILLIVAGFTTAQIRTHNVNAPMLLKKISPVNVEGVIHSVEHLGPKDGSRVVLKDVKIERLSAENTPHKVRLKIRKDEGLKAGQRIRVLGGLNPPSPPVAPEAFDFQRMMFFQGIGAVGFAYGTPEILAEKPSGHFLENLRQKITQKIDAATQAPQSAVLGALMTGQRGAIREEDRDALRGSGLAHLLAISGLHVGMVAGVLFFFSRFLMACSMRLALHYPIKKWAAVIALIGALFYTLIVGATIPTQRALIMTGLVMVAILFDRTALSLRLVGLAAFLVLLFSPESLTSVSFQMSFSAVVALICFYEYIRPYWIALHRQMGITRRIILYFIGVTLTTLIAGTATGLFSLYHFQQYAMYGMVGNLIAVPLMGFVVMPLIVLSYVLMPLGLGAPALAGAEWGVSYILATAHWVNNMEGAVLHVPSWPQWIFILMVISSWTWMVWRGRLRHVMIPLFILLMGLAALYRPPDILISNKLDLIAVRDSAEGTLWLSTGRTERYTAENWRRLNGEGGIMATKKIWPKEGDSKTLKGTQGFPLQCDVFGCRGEIERQKIAIAFSNTAWREDCNWADIIIAQDPVPDWDCKAPVVIDFFDVWRNGPHALWLKDGKHVIKSVEKMRGNRLWTRTAARER